MAGYQFVFKYPPCFQEEADQWLRFFARTADVFNLCTTYKDKKPKRDSARVVISIDGPLPALQHLHRSLPAQALIFLRATASTPSQARKITQHLVSPFMEANEKGLCTITDLVFKTAMDFHGEVADLAVSTELLQFNGEQSPETRERKVIRSIVDALDQWLAGAITKEAALILCDQAMETWLKTKLEIAPRARISFPEVLSATRDKRLLQDSEVRTLSHGHAERNRVQHKGELTDEETLVNMVSCSFRIIDRKMRPT